MPCRYVIIFALDAIALRICYVAFSIFDYLTHDLRRHALVHYHAMPVPEVVLRQHIRRILMMLPRYA